MSLHPTYDCCERSAAVCLYAEGQIATLRPVPFRASRWRESDG